MVLHANPDAHAEREAIRDAQRRLPGQSLAGVGRMYFGERLQDGGVSARWP